MSKHPQQPIVLDKLDDVDAYLTKVQTRQLSRKPINPVLQDVFGDFTCSVLSHMKQHWELYGFLDLYDNKHVSDMFDIVKASVQVRIVEDGDEDDFQEEQY